MSSDRVLATHSDAAARDERTRAVDVQLAHVSALGIDPGDGVVGRIRDPDRATGERDPARPVSDRGRTHGPVGLGGDADQQARAGARHPDRVRACGDVGERQAELDLRRHDRAARIDAANRSVVGVGDPDRPGAGCDRDRGLAHANGRDDGARARADLGDRPAPGVGDPHPAGRRDDRRRTALDLDPIDGAMARRRRACSTRSCAESVAHSEPAPADSAVGVPPVSACATAAPRAPSTNTTAFACTSEGRRTGA